MIRLSQMFEVMDTDGDGELTLEDLRKGMEANEEVRKELLKLDVGILDVNELFEVLDINGSGSISVTEFVDGALRAVGPASAKHLLTMHFDLFKMWEHIVEHLEHVKIGLVSEASEDNLQRQLSPENDRPAAGERSGAAQRSMCLRDSRRSSSP